MITGIHGPKVNNNFSFGMIIRDGNFEKESYSQTLGLSDKKFTKYHDTLSKLSDSQIDNNTDIILTSEDERLCAKIIGRDGLCRYEIATVKQPFFRKGSLGFLKKAVKIAEEYRS